MQQPDIAVQHAGHRLAGGLGVAVRDRDRMVLVQAEQNAGLRVAEMVDQAVVQPAIARARVEADIGDAGAAQHLRGDVAAPGHLAVGLTRGLVDLHVLPFVKMHRPGRTRLRQSCLPAPVPIGYPVARTSAYISA